MTPTPILRTTAAVSAMLVAVAIGAVRLPAQSIAITGGTVYGSTGIPQPNATVLIRDGRIVAVGPTVAVPTGARRIDAAGKWVTPGLINASTQLGLVEIGSVSGTSDGAMGANDLVPTFSVYEAINPASQLIPVARAGGVTTVLSAPGGGLISGQVIAMDLMGDRIEDMTIAAPTWMIGHIHEGATGTTGGSRAAVMHRLRQLLDDTRLYEAHRAEIMAGDYRDLSAPPHELEAMVPVLNGEIPLALTANRRSDIENALRLAHDYDLRLVLVGAGDGWQIADRLGTAGVPVVVNPLNNIPDYDALGTRYESAGIMADAGVPIVIATFSSHNAHGIRQAAGSTVGHGMTWTDAFRAVTINPATAMGIAEDYGALETGKVANVVVWSSDPFEFSSEAEVVLIRGAEVPLESRQTALRERYRR